MRRLRAALWKALKGLLAMKSTVARYFDKLDRRPLDWLARPRVQMISRVTDFALHQRCITFALTRLLVTTGIVSFLRLPIAAYRCRDVKVDVVTLRGSGQVFRQIKSRPKRMCEAVASVSHTHANSISP